MRTVTTVYISPSIWSCSPGRGGRWLRSYSMSFLEPMAAEAFPMRSRYFPCKNKAGGVRTVVY